MKKGRQARFAERGPGDAVRGRDGLNPPVIFQALLRRERSRSERDGSQFALVVFDVSGTNGDGRGVRQAALRIRETMRSIDEIGWIDHVRIGVLLPVTSIEGGRVFAQRVGGPLPFSVYGYPEHWLPGHEDPADAASPAAEHAGPSLRAVFSRAIPAWKSCLDIAGSLFFIVLLSPLFLLMAIYIKAVSPGKALYRQKRVGYHGRIFTFIKFRTMHENNQPDVHREYLKELIRSGRPMEKLDGGRDPRIIPGGKIIRKMCLDELPQLFNVLRGEMSLVGPRPCIPYEAEEYLRWHAHRFDTLPGMTGLWQVSGKNRLSFEQMIRLDIAYTNRLSLLRDLEILLRTGPAIVAMVFEAVVKKLGRSPTRDEAGDLVPRVTMTRLEIPRVEIPRVEKESVFNA
jgi:lipopolysaccharide/colanic/teichoic acid biosynthesis glycosyltransferase